MGKRKLEIKETDTKERLQVTFTKRRQGLFNKAAELCILCDAEIAVIAFSPAGKPFTFGHPSAEKVINRYASGDTTSTQNFGDTSSTEQFFSQLNELERQLSNENKRMKCHVEEKDNLIGGYLWDQVDVAAFDSVEQLESLIKELEAVRAKALAHLEEMVGDDVGSIARVEMEELLVGSTRVEEHWVVGPSAAAESLTMDLEDYGVLDEEFWNQLEPFNFTL